MPIKTSSGKWKWGNVERDSKKELVQTVYGIWKKNGSKGSFSDFLKGTHESIVSENMKRYVYHCTDVDPEIIKKEGWKVGKGFTIYNHYKDLYEAYLPKVPVFVSNENAPVWDSKSKYCIKIDITGLDLYPDFGHLSDFGAYYDPDNECFYWENEEDLNLNKNKRLKDFILNNCDYLTLCASDFSGKDSFDFLGTACVDGSKLKDRIIDYTINKNIINESIENLSKDKWYHGSLVTKKQLRIREPLPQQIFWVTTSKEYAEEYSENYNGRKEGKIYQVFLKDNINVFDPKNKADLKKLDWPGYFLWLVYMIDDLIDICDEALPEDVYDKLYNKNLEKPMITKSCIPRYISLAKNAKISKEQAKKAIAKWDKFVEEKLKLSSFKPNLKKGINKPDNIPAGYIRMKFCEDLKKLGYKAIFSNEIDFYESNIKRRTLGIFDINAIDKLTANPI